MKPSMAIQVRQLSSAKCRMAPSATHAAPGTEGKASAGLSRKATFRSSTEACRCMWMRVMKLLCFLRVGAWPLVAWGHHPGLGSETHSDGDTGRGGREPPAATR